MRFLLVVFGIFISAPVFAQGEIHIVHCLEGCPTGAPASNDLVVRQIYALSSNDDTKLADWAAYVVTRDSISTTSSLERDWKADPYLDEDETLEPDDYKGANKEIKTDRGHIVPLASFAGTIFWRDTNYLSNITPQRANLNQGSWVDLEEAVRQMVRVNGEPVWVVTGTLYEKDEQPLPKTTEKHKVPSGYWKVVATDKGKMSAFIFDQELPKAASHCDQRKPLSEVEARSGLDLFPQVNGWPTGLIDEKLGC